MFNPQHPATRRLAILLAVFVAATLAFGLAPSGAQANAIARSATSGSAFASHTPSASPALARASAAALSVGPIVPGWGRPMPCSAYWFSDYFGYPAWRDGDFHAGVDLAAPRGTLIRAPHSGRVKAAGWNYGGYGISVVVWVSGTKRTYYHGAHLSQVLVRPGQFINRGDPIGRVGATGNVTGPHLHFELWEGWFHQFNPEPYLRARGINLRC